MERRHQGELDVGTERGRSPSEVPTSSSRSPAGNEGEPRGPTPDEVPPGPEDTLVSKEGPTPVEEPWPAAPGDAPAEAEPRTTLGEEPPRRPRLLGGSFVRRALRKPESQRETYSPQERLLLLDTWQRSALPAGDFAALVGLSKHTLYMWKRRFDTHGPAGLMEQPRGAPPGSRLPDLTRRTILMLKASNPDFGVNRISDMLLRGPALPASPAAVARVLHEAGYTLSEEPTRPHPQKPREFERAKPNQLWQTDIFTFILKRQNRRVYLTVFLDDHSRFIVSYGISASPSAAWVISVFLAAVSSYHAPGEVLTDNGPQYVTWRGRSAFSREMEKHGVKHIVATPRRPQTLGKTERLWGTMWREFLERAVFLDLGDAQRRVGWFIDHYNLSRPHQALGGLVPADRFFSAAPEVLRTLKERAVANALELARNGLPRKPFYLTGTAGGKLFSVHAEGERVILKRGDGEREEIELTGPEQEQVPAAEPHLPSAQEPQATEAPDPGALEDLPDPLCPSAPPSREDSAEGPVEPGASPIDDIVAVGEEPGREPPGEFQLEEDLIPDGDIEEIEEGKEGGEGDAAKPLLS